MSVGKKLLWTGLGFAGTVAVGLLLNPGKVRASVTEVGGAFADVAGGLIPSGMGPIQPPFSGEDSPLAGILEPLSAPVTASDLKLQAVKPTVKFTDTFRGTNIFTSQEFANKLKLAANNREALEERARVLAGTINVQPQIKDSEGLTSFDRRVRSSPKFVGSKWKAV